MTTSQREANYSRPAESQGSSGPGVLTQVRDEGSALATTTPLSNSADPPEWMLVSDRLRFHD